MKRINLDKISFKNYPVAYVSLFLVSLFSLLYFFNRIIFAPKILLLCIIISAATFLGKLQILLKDWFVFLSFVYLSDSLRGLIYISTCKFNLPVHTLYVIKAEKFLFGEIPSVTLQRLLLKSDTYPDFSWFEKFLTALHGTHFVAFLFVGLIIWIQKSNYFRAYKTSFYLLTAIGVSGYFIIPTTPPWMASELFNIIPKLIQFNANIYNMFIPDITAGFATNPIAAMPSLHAAFPLLCCFILWRIYRWKASIFFLYTFLILFTIVYTGDHYIVDIIAGALVALFCLWCVFKTKKIYSPSDSKRRVSLEKKENALKKNKHLILGTLILTIGISIGFWNKDKFGNILTASSYSYLPNYIDFLNHEEDYRQNFHVQFYFGSYHLARKEIKKALLYFERALDLSPDIIERKMTLMKITQCKSLLGQK